MAPLYDSPACDDDADESADSRAPGGLNAKVPGSARTPGDV